MAAFRGTKGRQPKAPFMGTKGDHRTPSSVGRTMKGQGYIKMSPISALIASRYGGQKMGPGFKG